MSYGIHAQQSIVFEEKGIYLKCILLFTISDTLINFILAYVMQNIDSVLTFLSSIVWISIYTCHKTITS